MRRRCVSEEQSGKRTDRVSFNTERDDTVWKSFEVIPRLIERQFGELFTIDTDDLVSRT